MRKILAILVCKAVKKIGSYFGRGSSLPGKIALKICPDILQRIALPENSIAISGSNGKTSCVEMVHKVLSDAGMQVAYNSEGSNQIEGVTTMIIDNCDLSGRFRKDVLLMEVDERYAKHIFQYLVPRYFIINNLYRDQLTRNGHPEFVFNDISRAVKPSMTLLLNGDDPLVASLGKRFDNKCIYFGIEENPYVTETVQGVYDDGYYCPVCHHKMVYDYHQFAHIGSYHCTACDFSRPVPDYAITSIDKENGEIEINDSLRLKMALRTTHNAYNILAAYAVSKQVGIADRTFRSSLNNYLIRNGRIKRFIIGDKQGTLLISKHENSISYNNNLAYLVDSKQAIDLLMIIDDISRKYFTSDTSWLWDIDFSLLKAANIRQIVVAGKYLYDVAVRLDYAGVNMNKVVLKKETADAVAYLKDNSKASIYALTCFSDEGKLLKEVETVQ